MAGSSRLGARIESALTENDARMRRSARAAVVVGVATAMAVVVAGVLSFLMVWFVLTRVLV